MDSCIDEKSKATIEKMLQEEQYPLFHSKVFLSPD